MNYAPIAIFKAFKRFWNVSKSENISFFNYAEGGKSEKQNNVAGSPRETKNKCW